MKRFKNKIVPAMAAAAWLMTSAVGFCAADSWLDKGINVLKSFGSSKPAQELTLEQIGAGLKEALKVGSGNVVKQLGATDGFNTDQDIHIPLPQTLDRVKAILTKFNMAYLFEDLELKLNRAAESATPKAKQLFLDAIARMTIEDIKGIYNGPDDAATRYFKEKMSEPLSLEMKPVIEDSLSQVGALQAYDRMMGRYKTLPLVPDVKANLTGYAVEKAMEGIFFYMAKEEAAIRQDPLKRTTQLLKTVFDK